MDLEVEVAIEGLEFTSTGSACGSSGSNGTYVGSMTVTGFSDEAHNELANVTVSDPNPCD